MAASGRASRQVRAAARPAGRAPAGVADDRAEGDQAEPERHQGGSRAAGARQGPDCRAGREGDGEHGLSTRSRAVMIAVVPARLQG